MTGIDYGGVEVKSFGFEQDKVGTQITILNQLGTHMITHLKMKYLNLTEVQLKYN